MLSSDGRSSEATWREEIDFVTLAPSIREGKRPRVEYLGERRNRTPPNLYLTADQQLNDCPSDERPIHPLRVAFSSG